MTSLPIPIPLKREKINPKNHDDIHVGASCSSYSLLCDHIDSVLAMKRIPSDIKNVFFLGFCSTDNTYAMCLRNNNIVYQLCFFCDARSNNMPRCFSYDQEYVSSDTSNAQYIAKKTLSRYIPLINHDTALNMINSRIISRSL